MKILIAEDELVSRTLLTQMLSPYGICDSAVNGCEALEAVELAYKNNEPYNLICLDIMMPKMNGQEALVKIRDMEEGRGIYGLDRTKVIMTTCLGDAPNILRAFSHGQCEAYLTKPVLREKLYGHLRQLGLCKKPEE